MRKIFVAGNWKMNLDRAAARALAAGLAGSIGSMEGIDLGVAPPFPYLADVSSELEGTRVALAAQNCYPKPEGAFTGEVSPAMLLDVGVKHVICGHSERRHVMGEDDALINEKVRFALSAGLDVILCIGELLEERESDRTEAVLERQLTKGLEGVGADEMGRVVVAYEPVWAIGTGRTATPETAQDAHRFARSLVERLYDAEVAEALRIQYGGSVKPDNALGLLKMPDIDGALVGGASLKTEDFTEIAKAGLEAMGS
jgi:triosephosphate isomerase